MLQNWCNQSIVLAGAPVKVLLAHIYHFCRLLPCCLGYFQSLLTRIVGALLLPDLDATALVHIGQDWWEETIGTSARLVLGSRVELFQCLRSTAGISMGLFSSMALWSVFRWNETLSSWWVVAECTTTSSMLAIDKEGIVFTPTRWHRCGRFVLELLVLGGAGSSHLVICIHRWLLERPFSLRASWNRLIAEQVDFRVSQDCTTLHWLSTIIGSCLKLHCLLVVQRQLALPLRLVLVGYDWLARFYRRTFIQKLRCNQAHLA